MCRFLEVTKSTLTQWPSFLSLIGNLEHNAWGLQTSTTVIHTAFLRIRETLQKFISWWYRREVVDTTTNAWLSNHGTFLCANLQHISTCFALYTVRCQSRDSVDVLTWPQLQWLHAVLLWPQLQCLFIHSQYMYCQFQCCHIKCQTTWNTSCLTTYNIGAATSTILYFSHLVTIRTMSYNISCNTSCQSTLTATLATTAGDTTFRHESPHYLQPVLPHYLHHEPQL